MVEVAGLLSVALSAYFVDTGVPITSGATSTSLGGSIWLGWGMGGGGVLALGVSASTDFASNSLLFCSISCSASLCCVTHEIKCAYILHIFKIIYDTNINSFTHTLYDLPAKKYEISILHIILCTSQNP